MWAAKAPTHGSLRDNLEDITLLVGGQPLLKDAGDALEAVRLENLGGARRAWADKEYFGLDAGKGDPRKLRAHIAGLRRATRAPTITQSGAACSSASAS